MNTELVPGTRLLVSRRGYRHLGIYAGHGRVIHCAGRNRYPLDEPRSPQVESLTGPMRLPVRAPVMSGPRWQRFLKLVSLGESQASLAGSVEAHAARWGADMTRWIDVW